MGKTSRDNYIDARKELLEELKKLGVKNPAKLYPTVKGVAHENDPTCTVLRMKMHIEELKAKQ